MSDKGVVFIDANRYLNLYQIPSGKRVVEGIQQQEDHILVTPQVIDEVHRNKVKVTAIFLADALRKLELSGIGVPDHLLSAGDDRVVQVRKKLQGIHDDIKKIKEEFNSFMLDLLDQVSQSKDAVSIALADVFSRAVEPIEGEMLRARDRRERGSPPGKSGDPLGDQVNWEQILTQCKDKPKLWIITKDSDYGTVHAGKMFLNASLYQELAQLYQSEPPVFCFSDILDGLRHFAAETGVKADKLPTPEETKQIKKEQELLPSLDFLTNYDEGAQILLLHGALRQSDSLRAVLANVLNTEQAIPPPEPPKSDETDS